MPQSHCHIVFPPRFQCQINQHMAGVLCRARLPENLGNCRLWNHIGQTIGTEQYLIAIGQPHLINLHLYWFAFRANHIEQNVSQRVLGRLAPAALACATIESAGQAILSRAELSICYGKESKMSFKSRGVRALVILQMAELNELFAVWRKAKRLG